MVGVSDLADVPLFASLGDDQLGILAAAFEKHTVSAGTRLIGEGASGYSFFVLIDGRVVVTSGDVTLAELGPGDFFGEVAILGDGRRSATVTAAAPSQVLTMFGTEFRQLETAQPEIAKTILETMQARIG